MPRIVISILTYSAVTLAKRCVDSVLRDSADAHLILTANGNPEAEKLFRGYAASDSNVTVVVNEKNEGFVHPNRHAFNLAVEMGAEYFVLLNDDMTVVGGWLDVLLRPFDQFPKAALSGPDGGCCHILPNFHGTQGPFEYLEGSCLCCKVSIIQKLGLFPPPLSGAYGEDSCLSLRVREAGYTIHREKLHLPHVRGATSSTVPQARAWQESNHTWLKKRFAHYLKVRHFEHPIVVRRADAWGDVLLTTPIIRALHEQRPLSPILVETNCTDIFRDNPYVKGVSRGPAPVPKDALVIDLNMAYEKRTEVHIVDAYADATREALGDEFEVRNRSLDFYVRPNDAMKMVYTPGGKTCVVHPGPVNWASKMWPMERWHVVTKAMLAAGWRVILVGGRAAPMACTTDFRGATTIHQMASIIAAANLFIGLDSFPLHLAQAMGTPAIGLFGVTLGTYILTDPTAVAIESTAESAGLRHRTVNSREVMDGGAAMAAITPDMVLEGVPGLKLALA